MMTLHDAAGPFFEDKIFVYEIVKWEGLDDLYAEQSPSERAIYTGQQFPGYNTVEVNPYEYSMLPIFNESMGKGGGKGQLYIEAKTRDMIAVINEMYDSQERLLQAYLRQTADAGARGDKAYKQGVHPVVDVTDAQHSDP
jgi:hypothetical protein